MKQIYETINSINYYIDMNKSCKGTTVLKGKHKHVIRSRIK